MLKRLLAGLAALVALAALAPPAGAGPVRTGHLTAELVAATEGARAGGELQLALRQDIDKGWHTYWRNSGDSGAPTELIWTLPAGWTAGEIVWAPPSRKPIGPLMNYGYSGEVLLPVAVRVPDSAPAGQTVTLRVKAAFLVCSDICIPEDADLSLDVKVVAGDPAPDATWGPRIQAALDAAPRPGQVQAVLNSGPAGLKIAATGPGVSGGAARDAYFFPYAPAVIDHAAPQTLDRGPEGLTLTVKPAPGSSTPASLKGVLAVDGRVYEIEAAPGAAPAGASGLGPPPPQPVSLDGAGGLAGALLFAFLGGLILNLMPCVLPVLGLKLMSLAQQSGRARREVFETNLWYCGGVFAVFFALATASVAANIGLATANLAWGEQFTSARFNITMAGIVFAFALSFLGVWELPIPGFIGEQAGHVQTREGPTGAFLKGVLSTVLATPCSGPFLGPVLGFTLTQPTIVTYAVFASVATGMALPYILVGVFPGLVRFIPRPGGWMTTFKELLGFVMLGTVAFLFTFLPATSFVPTFVLLIGIWMGCWWVGRAQERSGAVGFGRWVQAATIATAVGSGSFLLLGPVDSVIDWQRPFTRARVAELNEQGSTGLGDFSADWCLTCKANLRFAI